MTLATATSLVVDVYEYENTRRIVYGGDECGATFIPVCMQCGRFVRADKVVFTNAWHGRLKDSPNASCSKCGRVQMLFEGFY